ncbi:MAG: acyl-CoA dehydrogenase family protein [Deltaproteobacteria bacterium]|nr:acyl-CoA dehydrogenase family protein [Deltaproteobacteria bacterium]
MLTTIKCELKSFEDLARSFAAKELTTNREANDRYPFGPFFDSVVAKAHEVGLLGATLPEECGGIGQGISALCIILDHICAVDASLGGIIFANALSQEIMLSAGNKDLLAGIMGGANDARSALIACSAFCNPAETSPTLEAIKIKDNYILNGAIEYVVLGGLSGHALVPARIKGQEGYTFFLIDLADKGLTKGAPIFSLGLHACPAVDLAMVGVEGTLIGQEGGGAKCFDQASDRMHSAVAAMQCGIMRGSFQEALAYSQERFQGGWEIINWSALRMLLGEMVVKVKIAEMVVSEAALAVEEQEPQWNISTRAAALHLSELACKLTTDGIQVLGGNGYMKDYGQEKRFRDAKHVQAFLGLAPMRKLGLVSAIVKG